MKKYVALLLASLFALSVCMPALASSSFDKSVLESSSYYSYDKFSKSWTFKADYNYKDYDKVRMVGVSIAFSTSFAENNIGPTIVLNGYEQSGYLIADRFYAIIDGKNYSFTDVYTADTNSGIPACSVSKAFCNALINAKSVAFQFSFKKTDGSRDVYTLDPVDISELADLKAAAKLLNSSNAWSTVSNLSSRDSSFGATIE